MCAGQAQTSKCEDLLKVFLIREIPYKRMHEHYKVLMQNPPEQSLELLLHLHGFKMRTT